MSVLTDISPLTTTERVALADTEGERVLTLLRDLSPQEWSGPSGCAGWDVRALATHLHGQAASVLDRRESLRQGLAGKRLARGRPHVDGITEHQVAARADWPPDEVLRRLSEDLPRAARRRGRFPFTSERIRIPVEVPSEGRAGKERWSLAYLAQVLTRDLWMHRSDLCLAVGRPMHLTPEHDGRLVTDAVRDWSNRHRQPFRLELDGPAGGVHSAGSGGPDLRLDAVEFCRRLFGRGAPLPYDTQVPF